jgi:threonine synthase
MKFYSTNNKNNLISLREAVIKGLAADNGLFMPCNIPALPLSVINSLGKMTIRDIGIEVAQVFLSEDVPNADIESILTKNITFSSPLVNLSQGLNVLELFHGPTLAFKDFGACFMAGLMEYFVKDSNRPLDILVATSGDTGSAVARAFLAKKNIRVIILYPSGKVSNIQEKQLTTLGANVTALEIDGTFDDCQRLVKQAFLDTDLNKSHQLTSANSINIARLIPQSFYYFSAVAQLNDLSRPIVFSVPSGNFGNLTAGIIAKRMGLPIKKFIASTNINDIIPEYLKTGVFNPRPSVQTISNAMDVGNPSNYARIIDLYNNNISSIREEIIGYSFNDKETRDGMRELYDNYKYVADPHTAVAYKGVIKHSNNLFNENFIFLSTAHPAKFPEECQKTLEIKVLVPERLAVYLEKEKHSIKLSKDFSTFKEFLHNFR